MVIPYSRDAVQYLLLRYQQTFGTCALTTSATLHRQTHHFKPLARQGSPRVSRAQALAGLLKGFAFHMASNKHLAASTLLPSSGAKLARLESISVFCSLVLL